MREKLLEIAKRIRENHRCVNRDLFTPEEILDEIATCIEDELEVERDIVACRYCGAIAIIEDGEIVVACPHQADKGCI